MNLFTSCYSRRSYSSVACMEGVSLRGGGGLGDDPDITDPHRKKKRYHRHTSRQIRELES